MGDTQKSKADPTTLCNLKQQMENPDHISTPNPEPRLHHATTLLQDASLAHTITSFINSGYRYMPPERTLRWDAPSDRLPRPDAIHSALGEDGLVAVIYDPHSQHEPIACAAAQRWKADLDGYAGAGETGWEIKLVTTREDRMRRGLAAQCVNALVEALVGQAHKAEPQPRDVGGKLQIWVQAVECLNGAYWKKLGWVDVIRSYEKPVGHWGSKMGYRLLVLLREFDI